MRFLLGGLGARLGLGTDPPDRQDANKANGG